MGWVGMLTENNCVNATFCRVNGAGALCKWGVRGV